jgi:hypothetical protein
MVAMTVVLVSTAMLVAHALHLTPVRAFLAAVLSGLVGKPLLPRRPLVYRTWNARVSRRPSNDELVSSGEQLKRESAEQRLSVESLRDTIPDEGLGFRPAIPGFGAERRGLLACELFSDSSRNLLRRPAPCKSVGRSTLGDANCPIERRLGG